MKDFKIGILKVGTVVKFKNSKIEWLVLQINIDGRGVTEFVNRNNRNDCRSYKIIDDETVAQKIQKIIEAV